MKPFAEVVGAAVALRLDNVDTDIIIPMDALLSRPRDELGARAFEPLRYDADGAERPLFILNRPGFRHARILVAGRNFGCGSSREGAVYALEKFGIRVVIAPSFGDIFFSNCVKNGVLPLRLDEEGTHDLMDAADAAGGLEPFRVNLVAQTIHAPSGALTPFDIDAAVKAQLLAGEDEIAMTLQCDPAMRQWRTEDCIARPWAWPHSP